MGGLIPTSIQELKVLESFATDLAKANVLPAHFKNTFQIRAGIQLAKELGLPPLLTLNNVSFINGKLQMSAQMMLALVKKSGLLKHFKRMEISETRAKIRVQRLGEDPEDFDFTMEDAKKAGLLKEGGNYQKHPKKMLYWRAVADACRSVFPDVVFGLYTEDELEETQEVFDVETPQKQEDNSEEEVMDAEFVEDAPPEPQSSAEEPPPPSEEPPKRKITDKQKKMYWYKQANSKFSHDEVKHHCKFEHLDELDNEKLNLIFEFLEKNPKGGA